MNWKQYRPDKFTFSYHGWIVNWFSNFVECKIKIDDLTYNSVENYYQANKSLDRRDHQRIAPLTPSKSKQEGKLLNVRSDWNDVKYDIMKYALRIKWNTQPWKKMLLQTGDEMIVEWNNWNDKIWGVSVQDNLGENLLGKAIMEIRDEIKSKTNKLDNWFK